MTLIANKYKLLSRYAVLIAGSFLMIYPILWLVGSSLKTNEEIPLANLIPSTLRWANFAEGWTAISGFSFGHFFYNSFLSRGCRSSERCSRAQSSRSALPVSTFR